MQQNQTFTSNWGFKATFSLESKSTLSQMNIEELVLADGGISLIPAQHNTFRKTGGHRVGKLGCIPKPCCMATELCPAELFCHQQEGHRLKSARSASGQSVSCIATVLWLWLSHPWGGGNSTIAKLHQNHFRTF